VIHANSLEIQNFIAIFTYSDESWLTLSFIPIVLESEPSFEIAWRYTSFDEDMTPHFL
jgi:hypothetical protein